MDHHTVDKTANKVVGNKTNNNDNNNKICKGHKSGEKQDSGRSRWIEKLVTIDLL